MPTRKQISCRACGRSIEGKVYCEFLVPVDGYIWGPVGPVCAPCADHAVKGRACAMMVEAIHPDRQRTITAYAAPSGDPDHLAGHRKQSDKDPAEK